MAYSKDLRTRVLSFIEQGGSKAEAARRYRVGLRTVHTWAGLGADYVRGKPGPRGSYKLDRDKLRAVLAKQPDLLLRELASRFGVSVSNMGYTLAVMGISRKKNATLPRRLHGAGSAKA